MLCRDADSHGRGTDCLLPVAQRQQRWAPACVPGVQFKMPLRESLLSCLRSVHSQPAPPGVHANADRCGATGAQGLHT